MLIFWTIRNTKRAARYYNIIEVAITAFDDVAFDASLFSRVIEN